MDDLISRQAVIDMLATMQGRCTSKTALIQNSKIWKQIINMPSAQPTVDAVERKRGRWVHKNLGGWHCSECDNQAPFPCMASCQYLTDFCPNCGAEMRGEAND